MSEEIIRVLLVDDHPLVLDGIEARLAQEPSVEVIGTANNGEQALALAAELKPDVVLMDISMPVMNGFEATERFREQMPDIRVLILSMHDDREYIMKLVRCGASGYVLKDVSSRELIHAIQTVSTGASYFSSGVSQTLFSAPAMIPAEPEPSLPDPLTPRETAVLRAIAEGLSNKEIARQLDISVRTVETHRLNIKQKLDLQTTAALARYAIEKGLLD
ncbi:response regulator transcription factor [Neptuniibacter sp. CAU 1671]|uniref:response regulator n=1 Tax=Neptuniibacter sp. CAU 1671 TaxID=3032593 RepID=UPI0023DA4114|nr:response regulator transcription factor [Neptuniibacter sp. CAU 1671]MDF2182078.1 response regulator transcription factor [Neptuniibacter sp. CAU 1671]